ncbi:MAG: hypothetical protein N2C14_30835, partial [Planctomycetales bacterium]
MAPILVEGSILIAFTVGHFFLFCNVFRIRRGPELIWTAFFLADAAVWLLWLEMNVVGLIGTTLPLTILVIVREMRFPFYHGVFAKRINPS